MNIFPESCAHMDILQGWDVVKIIGSGSYGTVYHVCHGSSGKEAALKWIHIERNEKNKLSTDRFLNSQTHLLNEISVLHSLSDIPEIVSIIDSACQISPDGNKMDSFILMELLTPLLSIVRENELTVQEIKTLVNDIGRALQTCHERNIIHGDVKPENILFGHNKYKLSDFGVAFSEMFVNRQFPPGTQVFQPVEYEQGAPASAQGDLYSFGLMIFILFNNGLLPFQTEYTKEDEINACQKRRNNAMLPNAHIFFPKPEFAAGNIAQTICKAVSPDPSQRYQTVKEFVEDFNAAVSSLTESEKNLLLPYGRSDVETKEERRIYLSTGRMTPRFDLNPDTSDGCIQKEKQAQESGFIIPKQQTKLPEQKNDTEKKTDVIPHTKKIFGWVFAIVAIIIIVLLTFILLFKPNTPEYKLSVQTTKANITLSNVKNDVPCTVLYAPEGSGQVGVVLQTTAGDISLSGLAPETQYSIQLLLNGREQTIHFKTSEAKNELFQPKSQRLYVGDTAQLIKYDIGKWESPENGLLTEITNDQVLLKNARLQEQGKTIVFAVTNQTDVLKIDEPSEILIVLRTDNGDVYTMSEKVSPISIEAPIIRRLQNVTQLFDAYYDEYGKIITGHVTLEMYWMNELLGLVEVSIPQKGE